MNYFYFIGIDAAKISFDATILDAKSENTIAYSQFNNDAKGIAAMLKWVKSFNIKLSSALFCVENMGVYVSTLAVESVKKKYNLTLACPLSIKRSMGITRGKNDKIDSERIAYYALRYNRKLKLYAPESNAIIQLENWIVLREHLVKNKVAVSNIISTMRSEKRVELEEHISMLNSRLEAIKGEIKSVEAKMKETILSGDGVAKNYELLTSITGVGLVVATILLTTTNNFSKFSNYRQYACFCGVAPFEYSSGSSIRGKTKVSRQSSSRIKAIISQAALIAQIHDKQLKNYTLRKLSEGKNKWSVRNVIKNAN